jgi:hypothetical protein
LSKKNKSGDITLPDLKYIAKYDQKNGFRKTGYPHAEE